MYFEMMPKLLISFSGETKFQLVTDITSRVSSSDEIRKNLFLYDYYTVKDGETPEIIADKVYNDSMLHWVILLCNDIIDPVYDWVLPQDVLLAHVIATYGEENTFTTHHFEDENGNWVSYDYPNAARITNMQFEEQENEKKRQIKLLQPIYVNAFIDEVETNFKQQVK